MSNSRVRAYLDRTFAGRGQHGCWVCGKTLSRKTATADHLLPKSHGGSDAQKNLLPCCWLCNNQRGNRELTQEEWAKARSWTPTPEKISNKVLVLAEMISRQRKQRAGSSMEEQECSRLQVAGSNPARRTNEGKRMAKKQLWLTEPERDLVETALKMLMEAADAEVVGPAGKKVRGLISRRINEMLAKVAKG